MVRIHNKVVVDLEREVSLLEDEVNQLNLQRDVPRVTLNKKNMEFKKKQMELALARSAIARSAHGVKYCLCSLSPSSRLSLPFPPPSLQSHGQA